MIRCPGTASLRCFSERTCLSRLPRPLTVLCVSDTSFLWSEPRFPFSGSLTLPACTPVPTTPHHCPPRSGSDWWTRPSTPGWPEGSTSLYPPLTPTPPRPSFTLTRAFSGQELPGCSLMPGTCLLALFSLLPRQCWLVQVPVVDHKAAGPAVAPCVPL